MSIESTTSSSSPISGAQFLGPLPFSPIQEIENSSHSPQSVDRLAESINLLSEIDHHLHKLQLELKKPTVKEELRHKLTSFRSLGSTISSVGKVGNLPELGNKTVELGTSVYESGLTFASAGATYATGGAVLSTVTGLLNLFGIFQAKGVKQGNQDKVQNFQIRLERDLVYLNSLIEHSAGSEQRDIERQESILKSIDDFRMKQDGAQSVVDPSETLEDRFSLLGIDEQTRIRGAQSNLQHLNREYRLSQTQLSKVFDQIVELNPSISELNTKRRLLFNSLQEQLEPFGAQFKQIRSKNSYEDLQTELGHLQNKCQELLSILQTISQISAQVSLLDGQLKSLIAQGDAFEQRLQNQSKQMVENRDQIQQILVKFNSEQISRTTTQLDQTTRGLEETSRELRMAQAKVEELEEEQSYIALDPTMIPDDRPVGASGKWLKVLFNAQSTGLKNLLGLPSYTVGIVVINFPNETKILPVDFRNTPPISSENIQEIESALRKIQLSHPDQTSEIIRELTHIEINRRSGIHTGLIPQDLLKF